MHISMTLIVLLSAYSLNADSITSQKKFQRINVEHGLSQSDVNDVLQDDLGFMWFATQYGLNRYDGKTYDYFYETKSVEQSLSANNVTRLFKGDGDRIWVLTSHGLDSINQKSLKIENWTKIISKPLLEQDQIGNFSKGTISDFQVDEDYLFALVNFNFLVRVSLTTKQAEIISLQNSKANAVRGIALANDDELMIYSNGCFQFFDKETFTFTRNHCSKVNLFNQRFYSNSLQGNKLYLSYEQGLYIFDLETFEERLLKVFDSKSLSYVEAEISLEGKDGYWLGTNSGIKFFDKKLEKVTKEFSHSPSDEYSLSHDGIMMIYKSRDDIIWVATNFGVSMLKPKQNFQHLLRKAEVESFGQSNFSTSLAEDSDNNIWIGTFNSGVYKYNANMALLENFSELNGQKTETALGYISKVFEDNNQNLWILAGNGLSVKSSGASDFKNLPSLKVEGTEYPLGGMYDVIQDRYSNYWTGSADGLFKVSIAFNPDGSVNLDKVNTVNYKEYLPKHYLASDYPIYVLFEDLQGYIWIGGTNGVVRFNPINLKSEHFLHDPNNSSSLSSSDVNTIYEDSNGFLWIGTTNGLNQVHYNDNAKIRFKRIGISDGFVSNYISGIESDQQGFLWISTYKGIVRYHPNNKEPVKNFLFEQGLQHSEFYTKSSLKDASGKIYFGGVNGVTAFDTDFIKEEQEVRPITISSIFQGETYLSTNETGSIQLETDEAVKIKVSNFDYNSNRTLKLRYKISDFVDWIEANEQVIILHKVNKPMELEIQQLSPAGAWIAPGIKLNLIPKFELLNNRYAMPLLVLTLSTLFLMFLYWLFLTNNKQRKQQALSLKREKAKQSLLMEEKLSLLHQVEDLHYSLSEQKYLVDKVQNELEQKYIKDEVTNLFSRGYIIKNIRHELDNVLATWSEDKQKGIHLGVFCVEVDNFSAVKELYGYIASNEILTQVAESIKSICYGSDIIARWQGNSILILSRGISQREQMVLSEKIRNIIASRKFDLSNGKTVDVTVSIGFSRYPFLDSKDQKSNINWSKLIFLTETALSNAQTNSLNAWIGIFSNQFTNIDTLNEQLLNELPLLFNNGQLDYVSSIPKSKKIKWT